MLRLLRLWRSGRGDLKLLWFAARHPLRPVWLLPVIGLMSLYAVDPLNFAMPVLGFVDDLILLPLMLHWIVRFLPPAIRAQFGVRGIMTP
jgi:uncharacterized membrane protein YkvA (DUF1232 family)